MKNFVVEKFFWLKFFCFKSCPRKNFEWKKCWSKNFFVEIFFVAVFSSESFDEKIWSKNFLVEIFFVAKSFPRKKFGWKNLWSKNFWSKFLLLQNHFLGNRLNEKNLVEKFSGRNFFCCKIISSESVRMKKFRLKNFSVEKFFWTQNYSLANSSDEKKIWSKNVLLEICFWSKIFLFAKSFPRKQFGWKKLW